MEKFFKVKEHGSTVKTEVLAGITTFMAMAYILMVNANMFSELGVVSYNAIYIATAISAVVGTFLIAFLANLPLGLASGMGLNAFFVYTVCFTFGLSYANALILVLLDGVVFIILTLTGVRKMLFDAIPQCVRMAISAGIGLFIAFLGLQDAGIIVPSSSTCVNLTSFNLFNGRNYAKACYNCGADYYCRIILQKSKGFCFMGNSRRNRSLLYPWLHHSGILQRICGKYELQSVYCIR